VPGFVDTSDKVYQLLAPGRWYSPGNPASSTTKNGRHDIAKILLKVALKHQKSNQIISIKNKSCYSNINATLVAKIHVGRLKFTGIILEID